MQAAEARRATAAARSTASALDLAVDDAAVLNDSNRLVLHLTPCDVVARVTPLGHHGSPEREVELARRLAATDSPVAPLDQRVQPRIHERDGFAVSFWAYVEPAPAPDLPEDYALALGRLHAGLRTIELTAPHVLDRVAETQADVANDGLTPDLADADRALLASTLRDLTGSIADRRGPEQLLHGEPHPWNVLTTNRGPLFIDFENTARGPVEYDLAWVPAEVSQRYPHADEALVDECRGIVLAIIATHRWRRDDQHPSGLRSGVAFLDALREGPPWRPLDTV